MRTENQNPETFENSSDRFRRVWAENSGDWAFQVLKFLQGRRANEVALSEVEGTETYKRSSVQEQSALRFVAGQAEQKHPVSDDDRLRIIERDDFLIRFVEGETLGHQNWVAEIQVMPFAVQRAQVVDAAMFQKTYRSPELFSWIWKR
jgi:hypothetical protein